MSEIALSDPPSAQTFEQAIDELSGLLRTEGPQRELHERVRATVIDRPLKLLAVVLHKSAAAGADQAPLFAQPTHLFRRLLAAIRANDDDLVRVIEHEIRS